MQYNRKHSSGPGDTDLESQLVIRLRQEDYKIKACLDYRVSEFQVSLAHLSKTLLKVSKPNVKISTRVSICHGQGPRFNRQHQKKKKREKPAALVQKYTKPKPKQKDVKAPDLTAI